MQFNNNASFCWLNSAVVSFCWALRHVRGLPNQGLALPTPEQGLEAAFLAWSNVDGTMLISSDVFSRVYLQFIRVEPNSVELKNRSRNEAPVTFYEDLG